MLTMKVKKKTITYAEAGEGKVIVLLHGFTESMKIWNSFVSKLSGKYRVITIDLPGHGRSARLDKVQTMEIMADTVYAVLKKSKVSKCIMVGHSMGGYVTLAFAAKYPSMLKGFGLFHSHCFADSPEEAEVRNRTIALVEKDKFGFMAQFIPGLFPPAAHKKFSAEIKRLIQRASKMEKESVTAALEGMKIRADHLTTLQETRLPVLFIIGQADPKAPLSRLWEMVSAPSVSRLLLLKTCGHMGYLEEPDECLDAIRDFARSYL